MLGVGLGFHSFLISIGAYNKGDRRPPSVGHRRSVSDRPLSLPNPREGSDYLFATN